MKINEKLKLFIDGSENKKTVVKLGDFTLEESYREPKQQKILAMIDKVFKKKKINPKDIKEIKVNAGPGSYTSLRVVCAIANTLAWALKIEVNGKKLVVPVYE